MGQNSVWRTPLFLQYSVIAEVITAECSVHKINGFRYLLAILITHAVTELSFTMSEGIAVYQ